MSSSQSDNNKRIAKNTLMLYVRMLFSMIISNVVGGFVSMFAIISSALSAATSRFITFELGRRTEIPERFFPMLFISILYWRQISCLH